MTAISFPESFGLVDRKITSSERSVLIKVGKILAAVTTNTTDQHHDEDEHQSTKALVQHYRASFKSYIQSTFQEPDSTNDTEQKSSPKGGRKKEINGHNSIHGSKEMTFSGPISERIAPAVTFLNSCLETWDIKVVEKSGFYDAKAIDVILHRTKQLRKQLQKHV